jgi:GNAT superfamily N-acetyltransferase
MRASIRLAREQDLPLIVEWRRVAAIWLASMGTDQWSDAGITETAFAVRVRASIAEGGTWIAEVNGEPAGTIAIDDHCDDPGLWTDAEQAESVIAHRMITAPGFHRLGLGAKLLKHADHLAQHRGKHWVRLDAWTTNVRLHDYYRGLGFRLARIADPNWVSSALFERLVQPVEP